MDKEREPFSQLNISIVVLAGVVALALGRDWQTATMVVLATAVGLVGHAMDWWTDSWEQTRPYRMQFIAWVRAILRKEPDPTDGLQLYDVILGRYVATRELFISNLETMKSFAVWGITGHGKTSFLHSILHDLIGSHDPRDLQLFISDLKDGLDFRIYGRIPHLLTPIAETVEETEKGMELLKREMTRRANLFKGMPPGRKCNNLDDYDRLNSELGLQLPSLPRILAVFDEVQDIMAVSSGAEAFLIDLAKKGRAYGITLCCSTQLPDADAIPKGLRSQLSTRFVGLLASPRDYYAVAEVYKEHYDGVVLKPGQFFARVPGHPMWSVMQATLIPDRELERVAAAVSRGQAAPEWPRVEATTETAVRGKRPWQGSAAQKRAMVRAWLTQFDEKPSAVDFMAEFEASEPTANTWIDKVWTTVSPR